MNWPHFHLLINHFPIIGIFLAILYWVVALVRRSRELQTVGMWLIVFLAVMTIPTFISGDEAAEALASLPMASPEKIGTHHEAAEFALTLMEVLGVWSLAGCVLFRKRESYPAWFLYVTLLLILVLAATMARTANLGGQIMHLEISET
ncbi:MAG: hypothetical protein AB1714_21750 [Acidobacteriota bacterium]